MSTAKTLTGYSDQEDIFKFSVADNEIVLAHVSDFGRVLPAAALVASMVNAWNPNAIFTSGDNAHFDEGYDVQLTPYYGNWVDRKLFFPAMGNHDYDDGTGEAYFDYFSEIVQGRYYYRMTLGPVTIFLLDGNSVSPDGNTANSAQAQWLDREARACKSPWRLAAIHQPPYSSDTGYGNDENTQWDYAGAGIDVLFGGHTHTYERFYRDGMHYINNSLGGSDMRTFSSDVESGSVVRYNALNGAGLVMATPTRFVWRFYSWDNALVDELILEK
jgi:predicted phosphodiesterase